MVKPQSRCSGETYCNRLILGLKISVWSRCSGEDHCNQKGSDLTLSFLVDIALVQRGKTTATVLQATRLPIKRVTVLVQEGPQLQLEIHWESVVLSPRHRPGAAGDPSVTTSVDACCLLFDRLSQARCSGGQVCNHHPLRRTARRSRSQPWCSTESTCNPE